MQDLAIFALGHQRSRWLAQRVAAIANNVAHADTPGYRPSDIAPFDAVLGAARVEQARTQTGHVRPDGAASRAWDLVPRPGASDKHSGNGVSLENEMADLGETRSQQSSVTGIIGAFHRMLLSTVKS